MVTAFLVGMTLAVGQADPAPSKAPAAVPSDGWTAAPGSSASTTSKPVPAITPAPDGWTATPAPGSAPSSPIPSPVQRPVKTLTDTTERSGLPSILPVAAYPDSGPPGAAAATSASTSDEPVEAEPGPGKPYRRGLPAPMNSPPLPSSDWQGYPLIGVPPDTTVWPLQQLLQGTWYGDLLNDERIRIYGWANASANVSNAHNSNMPTSYWFYANQVELDQLVLRVERQVDSVQTDHWDWGFRSTLLYGTDYRYMVSGGWFSDQLLLHNRLYGADPTEQYIDLYTPGVAQGLILRIGRWIACPDIETQFAPDNYLGSHSILFTFDTYTQTGIMATIMLNDQWTIQACLHSGTDMAPWYKGAIATGMFGIRWVSPSNNDSVYTVLNSINNAKFRTFAEQDQPSGHDNFNYIVSTWQHRFNQYLITKTEAYYMWQFDAFVGGTPSLGPVEPFGGGGGLGAPIPGPARTYGAVNYTMFQFSHKDCLTIRNEYWRDEEGERSGFPSTYTSNTVGITHNFNELLQVRPEVGYYRSWTVPAFDLGTRKNLFMVACDVTLRF